MLDDRPAPQLAPARSLPELLLALDECRNLPLRSLRQTLAELQLVDAATLNRLAAEAPGLLRERSAELVRRQLLSPDQLGRALARVAGLPEADVLRFEVAPEVLASLPLATARSHTVVPLGLANERLFVAAGTPTDAELHRHLCSVSGHHVTLVWAPLADITQRLERWGHPASLPGESTAVAGDPLDLPVDTLVSEALLEIDTGVAQEASPSANDLSGMVRLVKKMIVDAQAVGASDIHIETNPGEQVTRIRLRRDGDLEPYLELPGRLRAPLVSRIKVMARLDIAEHRRPQDGKINFAEFGGDKLELRVAVMPTHDGLEDVVLRLLASAKPIPLARLGLQPRDQATMLRMFSHSFGLVLVVGPTGSGKTTTLHSLLAEINTEERKIWTAEDPIEITQPGLRQVQVNAKIGLSFAAAMRSFLRADPDVIMIGEIRDEETARIAIEASLTGHLVLSTLHTNNASESVVRLLDLGLDPMNFADSLVGIVAQRLARSLCPHCAVPQRLNAGQFSQLVAEYTEHTALTAEQGQQRLLQAAGVATPAEVTVHLPKGCGHCQGKGYKGRLGIYEILEKTPTLRALVQLKARPSDIFDAAIASGMRSLR